MARGTCIFLDDQKLNCIGEHISLSHCSKNGLDETARILYRTVLLPTVFVIMFNFIYRTKTAISALAVAAVGVGVLLAIDGGMLFYKVIQFKQWNLLYDAGYILGLELVAFFLFKLFRRSMKAEVGQY